MTPGLALAAKLPSATLSMPRYLTTSLPRARFPPQSPFIRRVLLHQAWDDGPRTSTSTSGNEWWQNNRFVRSWTFRPIPRHFPQLEVLFFSIFHTETFSPFRTTPHKWTKADGRPDMSSPTNSPRPTMPATKRSFSLISTDGVEEVIQAIKYLKLGNAPSTRTASPPASTRTRTGTSNRRTRRSPRPTVNCRFATAFALPESEASDSSVDDLADSMKMLRITVHYERLPPEVLLKIFEQLAPTPVTPSGSTTLGSLRRTMKSEDSPPTSQGAMGHW